MGETHDSPACFGITIVFLDFDGVLNVFPEHPATVEMIGRMNATTDGEHDPMNMYSKEHAFPIDGSDVVDTGRSGCWPIHWSTELAGAIYAFAEAGTIDLRWLSTWQPFANMLDVFLDWDSDVLGNTDWYGFYTGRGRAHGKLKAVCSEVLQQRQVLEEGGLPQPIVWVDDEETGSYSLNLLANSVIPSPILMVKPDERIGISRTQWNTICRFVQEPPSEASVIYAPTGDE